MGNVILTVVKWIRDVWEWFDKYFMSAWEKWVRPGVLNEITGGLLNEFGVFLQELSSTITDLILDLVAHFGTGLDFYLVEFQRDMPIAIFTGQICFITARHINSPNNFLRMRPLTKIIPNNLGRLHLDGLVIVLQMLRVIHL